MQLESRCIVCDLRLVVDDKSRVMQAEVASYSLATLTVQLKTPTDQVSAPEFANMMAISYSRFIIDTIKAVRLTKDEVLVVDLGTGAAWIPPNLYFLSSLAVDRTSVRQIVFVETRHIESVFVGMCFPGELQQAFGLCRGHCVFRSLTRSLRHHRIECLTKRFLAEFKNTVCTGRIVHSTAEDRVQGISH
jgi:hypothetical protein